MHAWVALDSFYIGSKCKPRREKEKEGSGEGFHRIPIRRTSSARERGARVSLVSGLMRRPTKLLHPWELSTHSAGLLLQKHVSLLFSLLDPERKPSASANLSYFLASQGKLS